MRLALISQRKRYNVIKLYDITIIEGTEEFIFQFDLDGELKKILFHCEYLDELFDVTSAVEKYDYFVEKAKKQFQEWKRDCYQYDREVERFG